VQNYLLRNASLELTSSSYITKKENGPSNTHFKILGLSSNDAFYDTIISFVLIGFLGIISGNKNKIIKMMQPLCINRLLPTIIIKRVIENCISTIEKNRITIEKVFLNIENLQTLTLIKKEATDILKTLSDRALLINYNLLYYGNNALMRCGILQHGVNSLQVKDNIVQLVIENRKVVNYMVSRENALCLKRNTRCLRGFKMFKV